MFFPNVNMFNNGILMWSATYAIVIEDWGLSIYSRATPNCIYLCLANLRFNSFYTKISADIYIYHTKMVIDIHLLAKKYFIFHILWLLVHNCIASYQFATVDYVHWLVMTSCGIIVKCPSEQQRSVKHWDILCSTHRYRRAQRAKWARKPPMISFERVSSANSVSTSARVANWMILNCTFRRRICCGEHTL